MANETPDTKDKVIFWLENLLKIVRNDAARADEIKDLLPEQVIAMAEAEADKAVENSARLKDGD